jgi:hypothetical protein
MNKPAKKDSQTYRIQSTLNEQDYQCLEEWAAQEGTNITSILRKLIRNERFYKRLESDGYKVLVQDKKGSLKQVIFRD